MRSIRLLAVAMTVLVLGSACGGDDPPTGGENEAPVASFTAPTDCVAGVACNFTSTSTDDEGIATYSWDFDAAGTAPNGTTQSASFTFAAAGTYPVSLTVTDGEGLTNSVSHDVIVGAAANTLPTAGFTYSCTAANCTFTNTSTDADGTIASYAWDFGDPASGAANQSTLEDPTHAYTVTQPTDFTVSLTVTDNAGGTDVETQTVRVTQDLVCTGADCTIVLTQRSTVTITVESSVCEFIGNKFEIVQPIQEEVFTDGCAVADGTVFPINAGAAFAAGTSLQTLFTQGTKPRPADPDPGPPATRVSGSFPTWTIEIDDGGNAGNSNEPDFNDIVLTVTATPAP